MFTFTAIKYELKTYLVFSANSYREILFRLIGVRHPRVTYAS